MMLGHNTSLYKGVAQLLDIAWIMSTMIMQFFYYATRISNITIVLTLIYRQRIIRGVSERHVTSTSSYKLSFLHSCFSRFASVSITSIIKSYYIIEIQYIPSFIQHINGKNRSDTI